DDLLRELADLPHYTAVPLGALTAVDADQIIARALGSDVPPAARERLLARAEGNPFYLDELLTYLRDRGITPQDAATLRDEDWPISLQSLVLSRIDSLTATQQTTLKTASVIGRTFRVPWLWGVHPDLGAPPRVLADLVELRRLDYTPRDPS